MFHFVSGEFTIVVAEVELPVAFGWVRPSGRQVRQGVIGYCPVSDGRGRTSALSSAQVDTSDVIERYLKRQAKRSWIRRTERREGSSASF